MFNVYFLEVKNVLLNQVLKRIPTEGENLKIKGRKGKVISVHQIDEKNVHVQVVLEAVNKKKAILDNSKKKRR